MTFDPKLPLLVALTLAVACGGEDVCKVDAVEFGVTVNDTSGNPVDARVDVDGELCDGSDGAYICTAIPGQPNQVTATKFPEYQPATSRAYVDNKDCEEQPDIELRMQVSVK